MPITYKCASCGGIMQFESASQKLKCLQCGNTKDIETMEIFLFCWAILFGVIVIV